MKYRKLGVAEMDVSAITLGTWQLGDRSYWGETDDAETAVQCAIDAGINLFDSAEMYGEGESEKALGAALGSRRDDVLIASKVSSDNCSRDKVRPACEASLKRLSTDRIDLYQVHWPSHDVPFEDTFEELLALKQEGKIREIGLSNFGRLDLDAWMTSGETVSNQLGYNLLFRAIEYEIVPACEEHAVGILAYMPLMQGLLSGRWRTVEEIPVQRRRTRHFSDEREGVRHGEPGQEELALRVLSELIELADEIGETPACVAIAWLLARRGVVSVIVGGRKTEQIERNLRAADLELDVATIARVDEISRPLKESLGKNADMWQGAATSRIR